MRRDVCAKCDARWQQTSTQARNFGASLYSFLFFGPLTESTSFWPFSPSLDQARPPSPHSRNTAIPGPD